MVDLDPIDRRLLDDFQRDFPLTARPYAAIATALGVSESEVLARLARLMECGAVSRVGAVFRPHQVGYSTLAAIAVPPKRLEEVADLVNSCPAVNHNYQRDHKYNLWFVVTAADRDEVMAVLEDIRTRTGLPVLNLPLVEDYHIDLGFGIRWN